MGMPSRLTKKVQNQNVGHKLRKIEVVAPYPRINQNNPHFLSSIRKKNRKKNKILFNYTSKLKKTSSKEKKTYLLFFLP